MYIKKPILIICSLVLVIVVALGTIAIVNPFGALQFDDLLKANIVIDVLNKYYYDDIDADKLLDGVLVGATYSLEDPYTVYMNKSEADTFMENIESDDYTGVGLYISTDEEDDTVMVISPLKGSPAEEAGIATGDKILEVDGESVLGKSIDDVAAKMKGPENTDVKLKIRKKQTGDTTVVTLKRAMIKRETVTSKMMEDRVGYLQISQFGINTDDEFVDHFNTLVESGMRAVVIDLRNNPGGYIETAVNIADYFVKEGEIVYTLDKHGNKRDYMATEGANDAPMVVLTNGGSASASEIFVGAMKDYGLAEIVGEKTFGKGVTQIPYRLYDGSLLKITDSRYYTPKGVCIDKEGIEPDVKVEMNDELYSDIGEIPINMDLQLKKAIEILLNK